MNMGLFELPPKELVKRRLSPLWQEKLEQFRQLLVLHLAYEREILLEIPHNELVKASVARNLMEIEVIDEILEETSDNP